jgi:hypothetical protein
MLDPLASLLSPGATQCIATASCDELDEPEQAKLTECAGVDPNSGECVGATSLEICNSSGKCAQVDCKEICAKVGPEAVASCKLSEFDDKPTCRCTMN